jgi:hypothetical protein
MNSFLDGGYEEGGDPFISGDLEINNEIYNNPAVMVSTLILLNKCRTFLENFHLLSGVTPCTMMAHKE